MLPTGKGVRTGMLGVSRKRDEDVKLVTGAGRYTGDVRLDGESAMVFVRSPMAHARILSIDTDDAAAMPGVLAILTVEDVRAAGFGTFFSRMPGKRPDGSAMPATPNAILADGIVRYVGEPVAAVIAETKAQAEDAAEAVLVDYEDLPFVVDSADAVAAGAPALWPDRIPDNIAFAHYVGDKEATEKAFASAAHVVEGQFRISRVSANPIEPRSALAQYLADDDSYVLMVGTQSPNRIAEGLATQILNIPVDKLRVKGTDCGGAFGMKNSPFPEYAVALLGARLTGRPVRWLSTRSEAFLSDNHARDNLTDAALALDAEGRILAIRARTLANLGASIIPASLISPVSNVGGLCGVYRTPIGHVEVLGVLTNTQPTSPYRGAGRPEASYVIERLVDMAAAQLGMDRAEIRRLNMIQPDEMPFRTGLTFTYDSGDFPGVMERALKMGDWQGFPARRAEAEARGKLRGLGLACVIEIAGGPFRSPMPEFASIGFDPDGTAVLHVGSMDSGQGHATVFRQIVADQTGLDPDRMRIVMGDSKLIPKGTGTFGSRTMGAAGTALYRSSEKLIERALPLAADALEVSAADIRFEGGSFQVIGTDRRITLADLAKDHAEEMSAEDYSAALDATFPNGCHLCEVEIDPDTGTTEVLGYWVVDDVGTVVNPMLLKGQIHGGVAQGLGQILLENLVYDRDSGQLITGSFQDYGMPRADTLPMIEVEAHAVPTKVNPLGVKGAGEAGVVGSMPAVMNAVVDALSPLGITDLEMPATPERVWQAIQNARA